MRDHEYSLLFSQIGFGCALFTNNLLIFITLFYVRKVDVTYKMMICFFTLIGLFFSGWELIAQPFMHNYNNSMIFFSLRESAVSQKFFQFSIAFYAGFVGVIIGLIALQFLYRYLALFNPEKARKFDGHGVAIWMVYPWIPWTIYFVSLYLFCQTDSYADSYVRSEMLSNYGLEIGNVPRFVSVSYNPDGSFRWKNICFLGQAVFILVFHYTIIIVFGIKMHYQLKKKLHEYSATYSRLQNQIFMALILQTLVPTFIFILPAGPIFFGPILAPLLNIEISLKSGWLCSIFSIYPPIDSVVFMLVVSEYTRIIKSRVMGMFSSTSHISAHSFTMDVRVSPTS